MALQEVPDTTEVKDHDQSEYLDKLIEMRLSSMADAFRIQMKDSTMKEVPFEDRFGMLVDVEYTNRKNNRLKRLIRQAELEQPDASIAPSTINPAGS